MKSVNIHEAKTHLSRLVEEAARGEPFIIAKAGKPMVKVVPLGEPVSDLESWIGIADGTRNIPDDLDRFGEDEIAALFGLDK